MANQANKRSEELERITMPSLAVPTVPRNHPQPWLTNIESPTTYYRMPKAERGDNQRETTKSNLIRDQKAREIQKETRERHKRCDCTH